MRTCPRHLGLVLLLAAAPVTARAGTVGLLELAGAPSVAGPLRARLRASMRAGRLPGLIEGEPLRLRLAGARGVESALRTARGQLAEAEQQTVYMNQRAALRAAGEAIRALQALGGRHLDPELLARAHGALALALLLKPASPPRALEEMVAALVAWPAWQPGRDSLTPTASRLFERARRRATRPARPAVAELARLAGLASLDALLWVGVDGGELTAVLFERRTQSSRQLSWPLAGGDQPGEASERIEALCRDALGLGPAASSPPTQPASPLVSAAPTEAPPQPPPLYKRWWLWTIVSTVVVGAVLAVTLSTTLREPSTEVRFRY